MVFAFLDGENSNLKNMRFFSWKKSPSGNPLVHSSFDGEVGLDVTLEGHHHLPDLLPLSIFLIVGKQSDLTFVHAKDG